MESREWIRRRALDLGFDACGFAAVPDEGEPFPEGERLREWLARGFAGGMRSLLASADERGDVRRVLPGAQSVVALAKRYPGVAPEPRPDSEGRVARYARGRDYHNAMLRPLRRLLKDVVARFPGCDGHSFLDRGAAMEKAWAARAGLGWVGKNTLLLHSERGSETLLALLVLTLALESDPVVVDQCGDCRRCLDACPTAAFPDPYVLDARRCISYLTIENRGDIAEDLRPLVADHVFGCDVCQEVCPWNRRPLIALDPWFEPDRPLHLDLSETLDRTPESFVTAMRGRPLARPGRDGLVRNACVVAGNSGNREHAGRLRRLLDDASAVVRKHAGWALSRLAPPRGSGAGDAGAHRAAPRDRG